MNEQWQELKKTIIELRDNDGTGTQQEVCKFLANYMNILEKQMQELKTGHWITTRTFMHNGENYCDKCKCDSPNNEKWNYCPNCGHLMVEPQERSLIPDTRPTLEEAADAISKGLTMYENHNADKENKFNPYDYENSLGRCTARDEYGNADIKGVDMTFMLGLPYEEMVLVTQALNRLADFEDAEIAADKEGD